MGEAAQAAVEAAACGDDAVARYDDGEEVGAAGLAHGARCGTELAGKLTVASRLTDGNRGDLLPHPTLEARSASRERKLEGKTGVGEVGPRLCTTSRASAVLGTAELRSLRVHGLPCGDGPRHDVSGRVVLPRVSVGLGFVTGRSGLDGVVRLNSSGEVDHGDNDFRMGRQGGKVEGAVLGASGDLGGVRGSLQNR